MELRTAESKSLIRRKTVKVNTGACSRSKAKPDATGTAFLRSFHFFKPLFLSHFLAFLNETCAHTLATESP